MEEVSTCFDFNRHAALPATARPRVLVCLVCLRELIGRLDEAERRLAALEATSA